MKGYKEFKETYIEQNSEYIPKIIFRLGSHKIEDLPSEIIQLYKETLECNKDYEMFYFDDEDKINFIKENYPQRYINAYEKLIPKAFRADFCRYLILYKYGGVYMDFSSSLLIPLDYIIKSYKNIYVRDRIVCPAIANGFIATIKESEILKLCIDECLYNIENNYYGFDCLCVTGTIVLGNAIVKSNIEGLFVDDKIQLGHINNNTYIYSWEWTTEDFAKDIDNQYIIKFHSDNHYDILYKNTERYMVLWDKKMVFKKNKKLHMLGIKENKIELCNRINDIKELYKVHLERDADEFGLYHYYISDLSIDEIRKLIINSDEYCTKFEIANFFWDGEMSELEINCIKSFVRNGFKVKLWSYNNIKLPNVESCDANMVLPNKRTLKQELNLKSKKQADLAAFSDHFRYKVTSMFGGWWFDTDCFCLKNVSDYREIRKGKRLVSCKQNNNIKHNHHIGCGAFWVDKDVSNILIEEFENEIEKTNGKIKDFGYFGPEFFTNFIKKHGYYDDMLPVKSFYAIHWEKVDLMLYPSKFKKSLEKIKNSFLTHIWTIEFKKKGIDKNNPIKNSLLNFLYNKNLHTIIVSSNYNDFLKITLPNNLKYLDKENVTIVTSKEDIECQEYCKELGVNFIISDRMYELDTKIFNRSKAINDGIASIKDPEFILSLDADIVLNSKIETRLLKKDVLYSVKYRYIFNTYNDFINKENVIILDNDFFGFFQLFNLNNKEIDNKSPFNESYDKGTGWEDIWFRDRFSHKEIIDVDTYHLGETGVNWDGRKSEKFK